MKVNNKPATQTRTGPRRAVENTGSTSCRTKNTPSNPPLCSSCSSKIFLKSSIRSESKISTKKNTDHNPKATRHSAGNALRTRSLKPVSPSASMNNILGKLPKPEFKFLAKASPMYGPSQLTLFPPVARDKSAVTAMHTKTTAIHPKISATNPKECGLDLDAFERAAADFPTEVRLDCLRAGCLICLQQNDVRSLGKT